MGLFDRPTDGTTVHLEGQRSIKVVGTSHYERAIRKVAKTHPESTESGAPRIPFTATLEPERNNPHDANAIAVHVGSRMVGHLSRADAKAYRPALERLSRQGKVTAQGYIYAGFRGGSSWSLGVKLPTVKQFEDYGQ